MILFKIKQFHLQNLIATAILGLIFGCQTTTSELQPPVLAPFENLDTLTTNDWWNRAPNEIIDLKVDRDSVIAFGIYTVSNNILKMSARFHQSFVVSVSRFSNGASIGGCNSEVVVWQPKIRPSIAVAIKFCR